MSKTDRTRASGGSLSHRGPRRLSGGLTDAMDFFLRGDAPSGAGAIRKGSASPLRSRMVRANSESDLTRRPGSREGRRTPEGSTQLLGRYVPSLYEHSQHQATYGEGTWVLGRWCHGFVGSREPPHGGHLASFSAQTSCQRLHLPRRKRATEPATQTPSTTCTLEPRSVNRIFLAAGPTSCPTDHHACAHREGNPTSPKVSPSSRATARRPLPTPQS